MFIQHFCLPSSRSSGPVSIPCSAAGARRCPAAAPGAGAPPAGFCPALSRLIAPVHFSPSACSLDRSRRNAYVRTSSPLPSLLLWPAAGSLAQSCSSSSRTPLRMRAGRVTAACPIPGQPSPHLHRSCPLSHHHQDSMTCSSHSWPACSSPWEMLPLGCQSTREVVSPPLC